ncbi:unnamed protein product [Thelazia callipaeda]|uniref:START domain-containing protein n=1 Tax=Thelazia callipaeda TaxID=103827 RepID=A0A0N5D2E3_THECL|nr:unnamed protein product [Thelazia callipaeda]
MSRRKKSNEESQITLCRKMSGREDSYSFGEYRIGKDRRQFIIVTVFDVCLTTLLWTISTVSKDDDWPVVFHREVDFLQPDFMKLSLFDVVASFSLLSDIYFYSLQVTAILRMFVLIFFYAILLTKHWIPVAFTTVTTTLFLVAKALFFFSPVQGNLPQYMVLVSSFVVAWFQLWLVPFHILPRERRYMIMPECNTCSDAPRRSEHTDEEFRSAMEYSSDSDEGNLPATLIRGKVYSKTQYFEEIKRAEVRAKHLLAESNSWKVLLRNSPEVRISKEGQIYYMKDELPCSPSFLFKAVWNDNKLWNKQISEIKVILNIDANTDLVYSATNPCLGGYIAARDFLDVRRAQIDSEKNLYEGFYVSVDSSILPRNGSQKIVRGVNGANYIRVTCSLTDSKMSQIEWIQESDLKCTLPRRIMETSMRTFFRNYMENLKAFLRKE